VEAEVGLASFRQGYQDRIRIGSVLGPLQSWLPRALAQFAQLEPRIQLQVDYDNVDPILTRVASGQLDIGVVIRGRPHARSRAEGLQEALLVEEDMVVLVPAGHPLAQLAGVTPEDLREVHLLTFPPGYALRRITDHWFRRAGCTPMVAAESGVVEVLLQLAQDGVGVAIVPRSLSWRAQASGLRIVDVAPGDVPRRSLVAVTRREDEGSNLLRTLTSLMEVHARDAARRPALSEAGDLDGEVGAAEGPPELR
jgi:DNA-binding transcriptional LysR family regulator